MKNITGTPRERKRETIKNIIFTCIVAVGLIGLAIYINNDYVKKNKNAILEPERAEFLRGIIGFNLESHYPAITTDISHASFEVKNIYGYATEMAFVIIDTETGSQNFSVYVSKKSVDMTWRNYSGMEFKIYKDLRTGKIYNPRYIEIKDEETSRMILSKGMYWFYMTRKYFGVDTLEGLKSKVEQKRQELKQELGIK